jgi:holin-like protein
VVATVVSTWLSIAAGALVTRALMRRMGDHGEANEELAP